MLIFFDFQIIQSKLYAHLNQFISAMTGAVSNSVKSFEHVFRQAHRNNCCFSKGSSSRTDNQLFIVFHNAPRFYYKCSQTEHKFVDYNYNISIEHVHKCNFTIYNEVER